MTTSYSIEVISLDGCTDQDTMSVFVIRDTSMYIPNIFSPNGDGKNDEFIFYTGTEVVEISSITIYDRWGGIMFFEERKIPGDPDLFWDGSLKGKPCSHGVYVYRLVAILRNLEMIVRAGDVTLLR